MAIAFTCECGKKYRAKDEFAGRTAFCSQCRREFVIPNQSVSEPIKPPEEPLFRDLRFDETDQEEVSEAGNPLLAGLGNAWGKATSFVRRIRIPRPSGKSRSVAPAGDPDNFLGPTETQRPMPPPVQTAVNHPMSPTQQNTTVVYVNQPPSNGLAVAGFVFSIIGVLTCGCLSPIGLVLSAIGLAYQPRGLAVAGCILGGIGSVWLFVLLSLWLAKAMFWSLG